MVEGGWVQDPARARARDSRIRQSGSSVADEACTAPAVEARESSLCGSPSLLPPLPPLPPLPCRKAPPPGKGPCGVCDLLLCPHLGLESVQATVVAL